MEKKTKKKNTFCERVPNNKEFKEEERYTVINNDNNNNKGWDLKAAARFEPDGRKIRR